MAGTSFFTGGENNVRGMLRFDASNPERPTWINSTQGTGTNDLSPHVIGGGMVYLPVGISGVLVLLGGADPLKFAHNQTFTPSSEEDILRPMAIVHVYDIETSTWLLDTSTYVWKSAYSPNLSAYTVPPIVSDEIGGE
ncbi:MAG: hypothetical protein Q9171_006693 [Xanthocarpia ochracea]